MIRRLRLSWAGRQASSPTDRPARFLAVSDERVATLDDPRNRADLAPLDAVIGCGDLEPDYLAFVADAFHVPLLYIRGNHDRGGAWNAGVEHLPRPLANRVEEIAGVAFVGLSWPGAGEGRAARDGSAAWRQAFEVVARARLTRRRPDVVLSHVPPRGLGDATADDYHRGFSAYHWLCRTLKPKLWLHGHTTMAAAPDWRTRWGDTTFVNVTGGVLIEIDLAGKGNGR